LVFFVASVWMLVAMVIAVRQALDYQSTLRAVGVCAIGWVIQVLIFALFLSIFGGSQLGE
jgi:ABC-type antimicrobial peptide transport system permease subunit